MVDATTDQTTIGATRVSDAARQSKEDQHGRALRLIREQYADLLAMSKTSDRALRGQKGKFLGEKLASANAVNTFAVNVELIDPQESLALMKKFFDANPELMKMLREGP